MSLPISPVDVDFLGSQCSMQVGAWLHGRCGPWLEALVPVSWGVREIPGAISGMMSDSLETLGNGS